MEGGSRVYSVGCMCIVIISILLIAPNRLACGKRLGNWNKVVEHNDRLINFR